MQQPDAMSRQEGLYQSLATAGAVLIVFVGVCHETVGLTLFPWALGTLGGPVGWHTLGIGCIVVGCLLVGGTLRGIRFPVFAWACVIAVAALLVALFTVIVHQQ